MATLAKLDVELRTQTAQFSQGMRRANKELGGIRRSAQLASRAIGVLFAAAAGRALGGMIRQSVEAINTIDKLSRSTGLAASTIQELQFAFGQLADVTDEQINNSLTRFTRRLGLAREGSGAAADTFGELGIAFADSGGQIRDSESVLEDVLRTLGQIEDDAERAARASELFGDRVGPRLSAALESGSLAINSLRRDARELGIVLSDDVVAQAAEVNDKFDAATRVLDAQFKRVLVELAGPLSNMASSLAAIIAGGREFFSVFSSGGNEAERAADQIETLELSLAGVVRRRESLATGAGSLLLSDDQIEVEREALRKLEVSIRKDLAETRERLRSAPENLSPLTIEAERPRAPLRDDFGIGAQAEVFQSRRALQELQDVNRGLELAETNTEALDSAARELGLTFSSAFEDAVIQGNKLRDVVRALAQDIARMVIRQTVTSPLAGAISRGLGSAFSSGGAFTAGQTDVTGLEGLTLGGFRAAGGPVSPGKAFVVGEQGPELFVPAGAGNIVPGGEGGVTIQQSITIGTAAGDESLRQLTQRAAETGARQGYEAVLRDVQRGGPVSKRIR